MPSTHFVVTRLYALPRDIADLTQQARYEGFRFMDRLLDEWETGANRFDRPGELLGVARRDTLVAIGGINRDPFVDDPGVGRLRHLYVAGAARRQGIGADIVARLIAESRVHFCRLRLRTDTVVAAAFYERLGFQRVVELDATHVLDLNRDGPLAAADR